MPEENSLQLTDLLQQAQAARLANQLDQAAHLLGVAFEKYPEALPVAGNSPSSINNAANGPKPATVLN